MRKIVAAVAMAGVVSFVSASPALASDSGSGSKYCAGASQVTVLTNTSVQGGLSPKNTHSYNGTSQFRYGTGTWRTYAGFLGQASWYTYTANVFLSRTVSCTTPVG